MKSFLFFCATLLVFSACTKSNPKDATVYVEYDSPIQYKFSKLEDPDAAAMVQDTPVSWSQLLSNDVALQELQNQVNHRGLAFAYAWAKNFDGQGSGPLTVFMEQPKLEIQQILQKESVEPVDGLTIQYEAPQSNSMLLAQWGDKKLTWADFLNANIQNSKLYERLFTQRMQRLNGIVIRRYLLQASKDANLGMEEFVRSKIMTSAFEPTAEDVKKFAQQKGISESDLDEKMMERLQEIVQQNYRDEKIAEYVAKNLIKSPIAVAFNRPTIKVSTPEMAKVFPHWGKAESPVLLYVGHWSCEDCGASLQSFLQSKNKFNHSIHGAFVYSFADNDREARMGAEASLCVKDQNPEAFWTFLNKVMDMKGETAEETINLAAQASGVDFDKFRDCFLKRDFQQEVESHLSYANSLGMTRAPLVLLAGHVLELPLTEQKLSLKLKDLGVKGQKKSLWAKVKAFFGFGA